MMKRKKKNNMNSILLKTDCLWHAIIFAIAQLSVQPAILVHHQIKESEIVQETLNLERVQAKWRQR